MRRMSRCLMAAAAGVTLSVLLLTGVRVVRNCDAYYLLHAECDSHARKRQSTKANRRRDRHRRAVVLPELAPRSPKSLPELAPRFPKSLPVGCASSALVCVLISFGMISSLTAGGW